MSIKYNFNNENQFVIEDYDKAKTFASFLPGIAGVDGIPMWSFYVNRGQGMGSFGVKDKDNTIMEFFPANLMYKNIELQGFRTFIKYQGKIHEIFSSMSQDQVERKMAIEKNILSIEEINKTLNLKVKVTYFTMPKEDFAAIVRKVEIVDLNNSEVDIEVLDGMTQILPFGVSNSGYQSMANLSRAWFDVYNLENNIPYYKVRATTGDSSEVGEVTKGNFYLSFASNQEGLLSTIFDVDVIFGTNTSLTYPAGWDCSVDELNKKTQIPQNKVSGGFTAVKASIKETFTLCSIIGHIASPELINSKKHNFNMEYIRNKEFEARQLVDFLVEDTKTKTSNELFDKYIDSCYLDNILRGGYPLAIEAGDKNHIYHVFSRKHGDTEREYNFFSLEPAYYSQGNGNFRDVNQNRRSDILFNPKVKNFNVKQFMSLIQADGYNPLSVKGSTFTFDNVYMDEVLNYLEKGKEEFKKILEKSYTPGEIITYLCENKVALNMSNEEYLNLILSKSTQNYEANFGEGYWTDHWTYNMDLIDTYLNIYPDKMEEFLFEEKDYRYFDSPVKVLKREEKYIIKNDKVRQYGSIFEDEKKCHDLGIDIKGTNWLKTQGGKGNVYETNLYSKLISLALNKFVTMDPYGMGIEMEGEKPGWNDAMNGLPGLFGSGLNETAELKRIVEFIVEVSSKFNKEFMFPVEMTELLMYTEKTLNDYLNEEFEEFEYWNKIATLREEYREKIHYGIDGEEAKISSKDILQVFIKFNDKINKGLDKALEYGNGIYPTYFTYEAKEYEILEGKVNPVNGYQNVKIKAFECIPMPLFLEGPARTLKSMKDINKSKDLYNAIKKSEIYDKKLKMYKTSVPLDDSSHEIGRARAFTAGWLEREAVFLHMEYKYLLALLKAGLYNEYYEDMQTTLTAFLDPEVYGRSTLENSSFIASSVNPDEAVHGRGFVARLSGSTAEMLSIWFIMMAGKKVFTYENGQLELELSPILPAWLFDEEGKVSFRFLGKTDVTYHNPKKLNTYGENKVIAEKIIITTHDNEIVELKGSIIKEEYAKAIRNGKINKVDIYFN
jgi:hypothetical protein